MNDSESTSALPYLTIFCPTCNSLVLDAHRCDHCGQWERPAKPSSQQGTLVWQQTLPDGVDSGITLADGSVYVVDNSGKLHALDANTGQPSWSQPANLGRWRIHEQVAVAAGLVVLGSTDSQSLPQPDKAVMALDATTGAERWRTLLAVSQVSDPLVVGDTVYLATSQGQAIALALGDGAVCWRVSIAGTFLAAPALAGDLVIFGGDQGILTACQASDGAPVWRFQAEEAKDWGNQFPYTPVVAGDVVVATCWNRRCYALNSNDGSVLWAGAPTEKRPPLTPPLVTSDSIVFCGHDRYVYCLDRATGQRRWLRQLPRASHTTPVLIGDQIYVASTDQHVYALEAATGVLVAEPIFATAGKVETAWANNGRSIFMGDRTGNVYALLPQPVEEPVTAIEFEQHRRWLDAAAIYARDGNLLRAADIYRNTLREAVKAAQLYDRGGFRAQAAEQYAAAGDWRSARRLYIDLNDCLAAAKLSEMLDEPLEAAQSYVAAGQWAEAGRIYATLGQEPHAAAMFEKAGASAQEVADLKSARSAWERAGDLYRQLGQPEKAVQLYKQAGQMRKAQEVVSAAKDSPLELALRRLLLGSRDLARSLASEQRYTLAAREFDAAGEPAEAGRMYELAGESTLAAEHYQAAGQLQDAARTMGTAGNWTAAATLFQQAGLPKQAADTYAQAGNRRKAAELYEGLGDWALAAGHWEASGLWDKAAVAWQAAGDLLRAGKAWEEAGDLFRAGDCYCQAAEAVEQNRPEEGAALFEQAMQVYTRCSADEKASHCDRKRRTLRKQPLLEVSLDKTGDLVVGQSGKLIVTVHNVGWGHADAVDLQVVGRFESDYVRTRSVAFGLGAGLSKARDLYLIPRQAGDLALDVTIVYRDMRGNPFPPVEQTVNVTARALEATKDVTPAYVHVHGDYYASAREAASDDRTERGPATEPELPPQSPVTKALAALRVVLEGLYPTDDDARRIAAEAQLLPGRIKFGGTATSTWHGLLQEASNQGKVRALIDVVRSPNEYQTNKALADAAAVYLSQLGD